MMSTACPSRDQRTASTMPMLQTMVSSFTAATRIGHHMRIIPRLGALLLLAMPLGAQSPDLAARLPADTAVLRGQLPNGVRYVVRRNALPQKRAELRLVVDAGSILEDDAQRGVAHFVEHMAFNGTRRFPKADIVNFL